MLIRLHEKLEEGLLPRIEKRVCGEDVSQRGAFPLDTNIGFSVFVPRRLGAASVVLRLWRDGEDYTDHPLTYDGMVGGEDKYSLSLLLSGELCDGEDALFYYKLLFLRGLDTLFTCSHNNVDFSLGDENGAAFRLLVYRKDFKVPEWFSGGVMYHVFVDRFCKGEGPVGTRDDAVINPDWNNGIPQFAPYPGAPLENNEFFGGNLWGVAEKLDLLKKMGVTTLYLSPIFKAYSNHKYDTGDYLKIDEMFGGEKAFDHLVTELKKRKMRLILDGVFNHTGDDSVYFNRRGKYDSVGAYQSEDSPYHDWFCFDRFPDVYESWWGIEILPKLNPTCEKCRGFLAGIGGVADTYIQKGIDGWRLDVADELSDEFLNLLRKTVKSRSNGEGLIIGEVWENAACKIAYGKRRRYFRGEQLDSVMNYPVRNAILAFVLHGDSKTFCNILKELYSSYPPEVCDSLMNLLGTHDTDRILTTLSGVLPDSVSNADLSVFRLDREQRALAISRLKLASILQFTVFGVPSVFYGDEAGLEGGHDPFCRMPYPWGRENKSLLAHYKKLGELRRKHSVFKHGSFRILSENNGFVVYERANEKERLLVLANGGENSASYVLDGKGKDLLSGKIACGEILVSPTTAIILKCEKTK